MPNAKKTWVAILIAGVIIVFMLGVAFIGGTTFFVYRHTSARFVEPSAALGEFTQTRARFAGQTPLLEFVTGDIRHAKADQKLSDHDDDFGGMELVVHRTPNAERREVKTLHVLTYQTSTGKLVHVDIPGWLLQFSSAGGRFRLASLDALQGDNERVTVEDLERHGPGLVLDVNGLRGNQVLIWTE